MKIQPRLKKSNQDGIVSIMVTLILMIVITLIVLGLAQLSRREQRQSLDRQLSTQAFFAAESAVNDARKVIFDRLKLGQHINPKNQCGPQGEYTINPNIDSANKVKYTCLLVSTQLPDLKAVVPAEGKFVTLPLKTAGGAAISRINIKWTAPSGLTPSASGCPAPGKFTTTGANWTCPYGVLRTDIVPTGGTISRAGLNNQQRAIFFHPATSGAPVDYATARGQTPAMTCTTSGGCEINIINVPGGNQYGLRLGGIYLDGEVTITAYGAGPAPLMLEGSQVMIDATGKAQDVMRRIQVRLSLAPSANAGGGYAIQSGNSLCKRFEIVPSTNTFSIPGSLHNTGAKAHNPMCKPGVSNLPPTPPSTTCAASIPIDLGLDPDHTKPYHLRDWGSLYNPKYSMSIPELAGINAGCLYKVRLQAADDSHPHSPPKEQKNESIAAYFSRSGIELPEHTGLTADFPDSIKYGPVLTQNLCFSNTPDTVTFKHHYLVTGTVSYASVQVYKLTMDHIGTCTP